MNIVCPINLSTLYKDLVKEVKRVQKLNNCRNTKTITFYRFFFSKQLAGTVDLVEVKIREKITLVAQLYFLKCNHSYQILFTELQLKQLTSC